MYRSQTILIVLMLVALGGAGVVLHRQAGTAGVTSNEEEPTHMMQVTKSQRPAREERREESEDERRERELRLKHEKIEAYLQAKGRTCPNLIAAMLSSFEENEYLAVYREELARFRDDPLAMAFVSSSAVLSRPDYSAACRLNELEPNNAVALLLMAETGMAQKQISKEQAEAWVRQAAERSSYRRHGDGFLLAYLHLAAYLGKDSRARIRETDSLRESWDLPRHSNREASNTIARLLMCNSETDAAIKQEMAGAAHKLAILSEESGNLWQQRAWLSSLREVPDAFPQFAEELRSVDVALERELLFTQVVDFATDEQLNAFEGRLRSEGFVAARNQLYESVGPDAIQRLEKEQQRRSSGDDSSKK